MNELSSPHVKDISQTFETQFVGMTEDDVPLADLIDIQQRLLQLLVSQLDEDERSFLLALKRGKPDWGLLGLDQLPALQWKLRNVQRIDSKKHQESLERLRNILES